MSFDPYLPPSDPPPASGPYPSGPEAARDRLQWPAILMMALGVLNLLGGLVILFAAVTVANTPADRLHEELKKSIEELKFGGPEFRKKMLDQSSKQTPDELKQQAVINYAIASGVVSLGAILAILGGVQMMRLRGYGLAVLSSIVVAIPCISPTGCCCAGELVGLWALIVLINPDVRAAFQ